jgi:hypothetical protein
MVDPIERLFGVFIAIFLFCSIVTDFSPGYSWGAIVLMIAYAAWKAYVVYKSRNRQP